MPPAQADWQVGAAAPRALNPQWAPPGSSPPMPHLRGSSGRPVVSQASSFTCSSKHTFPSRPRGKATCSVPARHTQRLSFLLCVPAAQRWIWKVPCGCMRPSIVLVGSLGQDGNLWRWAGGRTAGQRAPVGPPCSLGIEAVAWQVGGREAAAPVQVPLGPKPSPFQTSG